MRCFNLLLPVVVVVAGIAARAQSPVYKLGQTPTAEQIRAWDIAISPSGKELPPGSGTAKDGGKIYALRCAPCHGPTGAERGPGNFGKPLVGGQGTLTTPQAVKSIGSFWPYATTVWDYINRTMPRNEEGSLDTNGVYAVTAWLLFRNGIIQETDVMDAKSLPKVQMPNRNGFLPAKPWWSRKMKRQLPFGFYP
jgi:mono/diheme cytochrome c family protein